MRDKMTDKQILLANVYNYDKIYKDGNFLQYPADWIIRFWNIYLKEVFPWGHVLDYGCGSGNNSVFFLQKGYKVSGVDTAVKFKEMVSKNLFNYRLPETLIDNFALLPPGGKLPFKDDTFDSIIANQVLYYLPEKYFKETCAELFRVLRNGGIIYATMMGNDANYITNHSVGQSGSMWHIKIQDKENRLYGREEYILSVAGEEDLIDWFSMFKPVSTGYFDQEIFEYRNYHYIFVGRKYENGEILIKTTKMAGTYWEEVSGGGRTRDDGGHILGSSLWREKRFDYCRWLDPKFEESKPHIMVTTTITERDKPYKENMEKFFQFHAPHTDKIQVTGWTHFETVIDILNKMPESKREEYLKDFEKRDYRCKMPVIPRKEYGQDLEDRRTCG